MLHRRGLSRMLHALFSAQRLHKRPLSFSSMLSQWSSKPASNYRLGMYGVAAVLSWVWAYHYLAGGMDESASFVRQSLFNLKCEPRVVALVGEPISLRPSSLGGYMNMIQGETDIRFAIQGSKGSCSVVASAKREGLSWKTTYLAVESESGEKIVIQEREPSPI